VLINRLEAFAAGHFLIKRFTHGQIDMSDQLNDDQYPFMHVTPDTIEPVKGAMQFGFHIMFADIPRDKETKAEYQREVISDCIRLGQDLVAEIQNGLELFGFNVQLVNNVVFEPFMEEQKNTVTGVAFTIKLEVPWDWSACDIPAIWSVGGAGGSGGEGTGYGITLQTNGVDNVVQTLLNLQEGENIVIVDNGNGTVTISSTGGGGGGDYVSTAYNANHTTATGNQYVVGDRVWYNGNVYQCIANNDAIIPTNTTYWTLVSAGFRLRQSPVDWNATSGDYQILNKPTIPTPQGLQDVIIQDAVLTQNNTIDANGTFLVIDNLTSHFINLNNKYAVTAEETDDKTEITADSTNIELRYEDKLNAHQAIISVSGDSSIENSVAGLYAINQFGSVGISVGVDSSVFPAIENEVIIKTPAVDAGTATSGQVLTLTDAATGQVEYTTVSGGGGGTVTSVGLTVPSAFNVTGSPITTAGTLAITGAGLATQYVRGDGQLANFPTTGGGGSSVSYYLNGSINQGTIGGSTYYQMSKTAVFGAGTDFTRTNAQGNGLIAQFITDANDPNVLLVPGGNFNLELYFSASSGGGSPSFYVELYKYDGTTFTLLATDVATPEGITQGTVIDAYFTALAVPPTTMALTDRLALRVFVTTSGRTLVLHTEDNHLSQVITTLSTGINAINGLTSQVQNLATGTAGTDFAISSTGSTHTFNLPTASAANRGALSSADWSTFNGKQNSIGLTTVGNNLATLPNPSAVRYLKINADNTVSAISLSTLKSEIGAPTFTFKTADHNTTAIAFADVPELNFAVTAGVSYNFKFVCLFSAALATTGSRWAVNGPASPTRLIYRVLFPASTTGLVANGAWTLYDQPSTTISSGAPNNNCAIVEGVITPSANGTVSLRFATEIAGSQIQCQVNSYLELQVI
jgi:hypothetical protein